MIKPHRYRRLPDTALQPERPLSDVPIERQAQAMEGIRALSNAVAESYEARDAEMERLASSNSLSRWDMAIAAGINRSRVDQILRDRALREAERLSAEGAERVARHAPN